MVIADTARITKDNLFSQSHANIYNFINTREYVPLPDGLPTAHKFVRVRMPRMLNRGFEGLPFIVVQPTELSSSTGNMASTKNVIDYTIRIFIYTSDQTSDSTGSPSGAEQLNTITDNVVKTLNAHDDDFRNYGMKNMKVDTNYQTAELEQLQVFMREITVKFTQLQTIK